MKRFLLCGLVMLAVVGCGQTEDSEEALSLPHLDLTSQNANPAGAMRTTYAEMLADLDAERHPGDGGGSAWIADGPLEITARSQGRWTLEFETGPDGIENGGSVFFMVSPFWGWSLPQTRSEAMSGFTRISPKVVLAQDDPLVLEPITFGNQILRVKIGGRALVAGERLRFVYGAGPTMATADSYAERESRFWFAVDADGDGVRAIVENSPTIDVLAGPPANLLLHLPGTAKPGETIGVTVALVDVSGNTGVDFEGDILFTGDPRWPSLPKRVFMPSEAMGVLRFEVELASDAPNGVLRLAAVSASSATNKNAALKAISNPMLVSDSAKRVLWADLHGHSNLSDGTGTPDDYFAYARTTAALDVAALTDHDHWGVRFLDQQPDMWQRITKSVSAANNPGGFTSLLAFEWTNWIHGHRHVLYFDDEGPLISSLDQATDDPAELWQRLRSENALTFAHHSAGAPVPVNWSFGPDPELEPVTEISSVHGTSEALDAPLRIRGARPGNFVRDVLDAGAELGFIGSGDSHDGHPGLAQLASGTGGLAALFAEENTRAAVKASLKARACYATNGPRMLFFTKLGGQPMGRKISADKLHSRSTLDVRLFGTAPLLRLEVIRSGQVVHVLDASDMQQATGMAPDFDASLLLADMGLMDLKNGEYVYLRAVESGPGIAWSSPWLIR